MPIIVSKPHILKQTTYKTIVDTGTYLSEIVDGLDTTSLYIELNGTPIKNGEIPFIKLEENDIVTIINVPQQGGAGRMVATIATLAVAVVSSVYLGPAAANLLIGTKVGLGAALINAGVTATAVTLTTLAFNALIPPQQLDKGDTTSTVVKPGITGAQNRYAVWNPIPRLYGTYKYYPPLAARYFTEIAGGDQYLRMLLCLGYGPLEIGGKTASRSSKLTHESGISSGAIKIGDTDILSYDDVEFEIGTIDQISLFTSNIYEENVNVNLDCQSTSGEGGWFTDNVSATRNTDTNTKEISIDLVFPSGLYTMSKRGKIRAAHVDFKITITDVNSGNLIIQDNFTISGRRKETYRVNKRYVPNYKGQFSVKVTRERTYIQDREVVVTDCVWTALRSVKSEQPVVDNGKEIIYMALRIKATDQLSGIIDQLNVTATSILPVYDGSTWSNQATNNPAWCYYNQLTGEHVKNPISESEVLLDDFVEWAAFCDNLGLEFNYVFDTGQTQLERLRNIATTGRATPAYRDGYFTIVWDRDSSSEPPAQVISPRNSRNFSSTKAFQNLPHALRVRYIDKNKDYTEDEVIVYRDGYNSSTATRYEKLDTLGVTTQQQAWKEGKYHFNQLILRPETFNVEMDFENLAFTRGDVVLLAYDIIEVGIKWGRIKNIITDSSGKISSIILDEACPMETGKTYGIQIRTQNGAILSTTVTNQGDGEFYELYPKNTITGCNVGDLVLFGEYGKESVRCKVLSVDYDYDLSARITLIPEAPNVNNTGTIPAYDPHITLPLEFAQIKPPTPSVQAFSGDNTLMLAADGGYQPTVVVTWVIPSTSRVALERIEIRWKSVDDSEDNWHTISAEYSNTSLRIFGVQEETTIAIQARVKSVYGRYSDWSEEITHVVAGNTLTPGDVTNFIAEWHPENQLVLFTWDEMSDINLDHFEIREGTDWDSGTPVLQNITDFQTSLFIPEVTNTTKTYWIKAISKNGTESANAVSTTVDIYFPKPSTATGITTIPLNYAIKVKVTYTKDTYFDKLEIWASETNNRDDAVLIASVENDEYTLDGLELVDTRYFWVRQRNIFEVYSDWFPGGQYEGVVGSTDYTPDKLLDILSGSITEDELYQDLVDKIDWVSEGVFVLEQDVLESGILGGIDDLVLDTGSKVNELQINMAEVQKDLNEHLSQIQLLQSDISALTTSDWQPDILYTLGRIVRYNNDTWRCLQDNIGIAPDDPQNIDNQGNYVYWEPTDALSTLVANIEQKVNTVENEVSTKVSQTDFDSLSNIVSIHETLIQQNSDTISLKADKTEVNALSSLLVQDFDENFTYSKWDLVKYNNNVYQAIQDIPFTPAPTPDHTDYWMLIDNIADVLSYNSSQVNINSEYIQLTSNAIIGDIALVNDIVENGVVVGSIEDIYNLDNRISESYLKATQAEIKIDTLNNMITEAITSIENNISDHETRLSNAEETITVLQEKDGVLESAINDRVTLAIYNSDITNNLKPRMATAEQNITTLYTQNDELQSQINEKVSISVYDTDINNDLKPRMAQAEQNITALQDADGNLQAQIDQKVSITTYRSDITYNLKPRMATAENNITALQDADDSLQAQINDRVTITTYDTDINNDLKPRMAQAEQNITALQDADGNLQAQINNRVTITTYDTDITNNLKPRMATAEQNISALQTDVGDLQAEIVNKVSITTYNNDVTNDLKPRMSSAETSISTLQTDMGDVKSEWTVKLNADNHIAGIGLVASSDAPSELVVLTDIFKIVNPSDSNDVKEPFVVGNINGQSTVGINGDLIVDGSISARHIGTNVLITDSANIAEGVLTSAHIKDYIQSSNYDPNTHTGWKIDKTGIAEFNGIIIYDTNGDIILASGSGVEWNKIIGGGKPEDGATQNRVFKQTTTPSGSQGDLWYNPSTKQWYHHDGTGWVLSANAFDKTSELSDDAGLGTTAIWDNVTGTNKPEDNATVGAQASVNLTDSNGNIITDGDIIVHKGSTPPTDKSRLWIDTTVEPNILKRYDFGSSTWIKVTPESTDIDALLTKNAPAEAGATKGAQANVNLKDANGNLATDIIHPNNPITSSNISTYIASAAIGSAYIADAAITSAKIDSLAVNTIHIANGAVTIPSIASNYTHIQGDSNWKTILNTSVYLNADGYIYAWGSIQQGFSNFPTSEQWVIRLYIDGSIVYEVGGSMPGDSVSVAGAKQVSAGTRNILLKWKAPSEVEVINRDLIVLGAKK